MMKKLIMMILLAVSISGLAIFLSSCSTQRLAASKQSGAQLWAENCVRCHNIPSPSAYNDVDWETIGLHMRIRANLTAEQQKKIVEFLKTAN